VFYNSDILPKTLLANFSA